MPTTFYQRLKAHSFHPNYSKLSKKKLKKLSNGLKRLWDGRVQQEPLKYVNSLENGITYTVRQYPDTFRKTIDSLILRLLNSYPPEPAKEPRQRKRIPVKAAPQKVETKFYNRVK